eukprot:5656472-Pyramimonas_sp.AAC.1
MRVASNGEARLADPLRQDSGKRLVLSAGCVIPTRAKFFTARRDRAVPGEPRAIVDRAMWEKAAVIVHAEKKQCVQLTLPLKVNDDEVSALISGHNWTRQPLGTSVGALHS